MMGRFLRLCLWLFAACGAAAISVLSADFNWTSITPSEQLKYHDCFDGFRCARLLVPLDWQDPANKATTVIAVTALPAAVPEDHPSFGGTVIINPGGPGGSGTLNMLHDGHMLRDLVDGNKSYEILSFDPRGVAHSTPPADCYPSERAREAVGWQFRGMVDIDDDPAKLQWHFARAKAHGDLCTRIDLRFHSTAAVARDMLRIVDRVAELRNGTQHVHPGFGQAQRVIGAAPDNDGLPRIQYLGFSYGTILGNTFASMFPGRVRRMVLDGVADPYDNTGRLWEKDLMDTEKVADYFYDSCFDTRDCPLRQSGDKSGRDIRVRVDEFIQQLIQSPASAVMGDVPTIVTATDIRAIFQIPLYEPLDYFPLLAAELAGAMRGNLSLLLERLDVPSDGETCTAPGRPRPFKYSWGDDASLAYICNDGASISGLSVAEFAAYVARIKRQSPLIAPLWAQLMLACTGWRTRPAWRFAGPFGTPEPDVRGRPGRPSAPLLFLSARLDPVTPLVNAVRASAEHPGSAVLVQESTGHCAVYSAPSRCTKRVLERYFELGEVPETGTTCEADCKPWKPCATYRMSGTGGGRHRYQWGVLR